ncbi:putative bifunctional diguanylate cyclase/phosphodiesterase [Simiduia aestuariiviva]|uniref:Diguanylate cyclase (GGDEF)-like protein n=1 Tax=Simiduia aestuariiviva TaxID=1510459 RepID=A0A839UU84_9GAMM|nr:bifunctional diguanylate cyclase/phosphodiesterase [Simiduia aestuariiviva]MBB3168937.1 diguanylate cyclase (GGDEF)-like protein [Simiduia aestuariiviva]
MSKTRLFSLAIKAQLLLGALVVLSMFVLLYFHWQEQNKLTEAELTQSKLNLAQQLNRTLDQGFRARVHLLQEWAQHLPSEPNKDIAYRLTHDWSLLHAAGQFSNLQIFERNGQPLLNHEPKWPSLVDAEWINTLYRSDSADALLACEQRCAQYVGLPFRLAGQPTRLLVGEVPLINLVDHFNNQPNLHVLMVQTDAQDRWQHSWVLSHGGHFRDADAATDLRATLKETLTNWNLPRYHYKLLPISGARNLHWLVISDELANLMQRLELLKLQTIIATCALIALLCLNWLISRQQLFRLRSHTKTLHLLAEQQYEVARQRLPKKPKRSRDELDLLADVASELTFQLEASARSADHRNREMERLALYDPLTNLPNRNLFIYEIEQLLENGANVYKSTVVVIDVDKFQRINDSLGHQSGDLLLSKVADRIRAAVGGKDFCARLAGNVFGVLITCQNPADLKIRINKINEMIRQPMIIKQQKLIITASMGLTGLEHGTAAVELLRNAEIAMYRAKQKGGNSYLEFSPEFKSISRSQVSLEAEIHRALEQKEFRLYLQSKVDMSSTIRGFEALCRWDHPDRGILNPAEFVPMMADLGLQTELDNWMLEASCRQLKTWQNLYPDIKVSVNVASDHFSSSHFLPFLQQTINRYGIRPGQLELEITETLLMDNITLALRTIEKVKALGVSIAIDDFGTGYSSLSYLKNLPVDTLKIDREFIKDIPFDESDMHISAVIIFLARQLGFQVVAEGVETQEQLAFLQANHCDLAQGYLFSKPIPAHKAMIVLESQRGSTAQPIRQ